MAPTRQHIPIESSEELTVCDTGSDKTEHPRDVVFTVASSLARTYAERAPVEREGVLHRV